MNVPIKIDLSNLVEEFDMNVAQIQSLGEELIEKISNNYYSAIRKEVNDNLKSTKNIYLKSLKLEKINLFERELILSGWLPNALENGYPSFDMKIGFLNSKKAKVSKSGIRYLTIPFLWSVNKSEGKKKIPKEIAAILKRENKPLREIDLPENYRVHEIKNLANGGKYQHKNSIYTGLKKTSSQNGISFRRVSENSDTNMFWHPGLQKQDFFGKALRDIQDNIPVLADKVIDNFLNSQF